MQGRIFGNYRRCAPLPLALAVLLLWAAVPGAGQDSNPPLSPAAGAAWSAAQEAQQQKDYATAAKEYRKVISLSPGFAEAYLNLGLVYELQERLTDAIAAFEKAIQLKPGLTGAQFFLGVDYCKLGDARRATPHLEVAVRARPDLPDAWSWLASAYQQTGRPSRQVNALQAGLRANPQSVDLLYLLGQAYQQLGKDAADRLPKTGAESSYVNQLLAENYAVSGYPTVALLHLQNALQESPSRAGLHLEIAEILLHAGSLKHAEEEIAAELRLSPHSLSAVVRRGEIELLLGEVKAALADWSQALAGDAPRCETILGVRELGYGDTALEKLPDELRSQLPGLRAQVESQPGPASRLALAFIATQEEGTPMFEGAAGTKDSGSLQSSAPCTPAKLQDWLAMDRLQPVAECADQLLRRPATFDQRLEIARALYATGHVERALGVLDGLATPQADAVQVQYWKARCSNRLAMAAFLRLFVVDPDSPRAHQVLGDMDENQGNDAKAIVEYQKALAQRPSLPNLHYQIGHIEWKSYRTQEAREQFQAELAINPRHTGALFDLGSTYLQAHQPDEALVYLQKVDQLDPKYPDLRDFLGIAYIQMHRYADAARELELAAPGDQDGSIHYQLARAYMALGKSREAEKEFALSNRLHEASHRANEQRVQRLAEAEAALTKP